jgi:hypothetical protein
MYSRIFFTQKKHITVGLKSTANNTLNFKQYLIMTRQFPGGCVIKVKGNNKDSTVNKSDLLAAIPHNLRGRDCFSLIVDPAILLPIEKGLYELDTPSTHLAAFISNNTTSDILINQKTIVSKIKGELPAQITDVESVEYGKIKAQNYTVKAKYQSGDTFSNRLFVMPKQKYEYRYFIFLAIDTIKDDPDFYIKKLEKEIEKYIEEDIYYSRQNNSCVHPILVLFGKLPKELYESAVPQAVAVDVVKKLLDNFRSAYYKFLSVAALTGLDKSAYRSSTNSKEIFVEDNDIPNTFRLKK